MANKMFEVKADTKKITALQNKMAKYPPYAIKAGMEAVEGYLNTLSMVEMYPSESHDPFVWSSEKQRRAYFASDGFGAGIPYSRTNNLAEGGEFSVNQSSFQGTPYSTIGYTNTVPYAKFVISTDAIIGMIKRGWKPITKFVTSHSKQIGDVFRSTVKSTWDKMEEFIYGGGAGL